MAEPPGENPVERPGLLSRLRGRTPTAPAAERVDEQVDGPDDEGWVHHESGDGQGFTGWLYHYADGTMVDEDGTVHEHVSVPASNEVAPEPEPEPEPEPDPEPEPESEPEPEPEPEPDPEPEPEPQRSEIPSFVEYSPSELRNYALGAVLVVASVAAVITLFLVAPDP
ncbi:MAG: hypothetical protein ABIU87_08045, partial [Ornithinibacter sp.]